MYHFESKRDILVGLFFLSAVAGLAVAIILEEASDVTAVNVLSYLALAGLTGLLLWIYFSTYYELTNDGLKVVCGPYRKTVAYENITGVRPTRSVLSAPALSLDRVEVMTNQYVPVIISPREKEKFMKKLEEKLAKVRASNRSEKQS